MRGKVKQDSAIDNLKQKLKLTLAKVILYKKKFKVYRQKYLMQTIVSVVLFIFLSVVLYKGIFTNAALTQNSVAITTQAQFDHGSYSNTVVQNASGGEVRLAGSAGPDSTQYKRPVTVNNSGNASTLSNYQILITLNTSALVTGGKLQSDCDDLRFRDSDDTASLNYWIESGCNTTSTRIWVKVPSISGSSSKTIYLYYGSVSASAGSSGTDTFDFFDNFDGHADSTDPDGWREDAGTWYVQSNYYYTSGGSQPVSTSTVYSVSSTDYIFDAKAKFSSGSYVGLMPRHTGSGASDNGYYMGPNSAGTAVEFWKRTSGNWVQQGSGVAITGFTDGNWHVLTAILNGSTISFNFDNVFVRSYTDSSSPWLSGTVAFHTTAAGSFDDARVRKFTTPEPSTTVGSESSALQASGTWTSPSDANALDIVWNGGWSNNGNGNAFEASVTLPSNTNIDFEMRLSTDRNIWTNWYDMTDEDANSGRYGVAAATLETQFPQATYKTYRYLQVRATLSQTDGVSNPTLSDFTIYYMKDVDPPSSNPTSAHCYNDSGKTTEYSSGSWHNDSSIYCEWSGAVDEHSGIAGYYVYFGTSPTGTPSVSQSAANYTLSSVTSGQSYYLRIKAYDLAGNTIDSIFDGFTYKFDSAAPAKPGVVAANPAGYTNINNFSFLWSAGTDNSESANSGVDGYYYKTGADGAIDIFTTQTSVSDIIAYQDNVNIFYVKTADVAGNTSATYAQVSYYYNGSAPSEPQSLTVDPVVNITNSFTFTWSAPAIYTGSISKYHYSINALPSANNTTTTLTASIGPGPFATQQGVNIFYVVAEDAAGNTNYNAYASKEFTANTTAPGIPTGVTITDSSIRAQQKYSLTITWDAPSNVGSGIDHYIIERSTDNDCTIGSGTFSEIAETATTGYLDTNLSNTITYCYKVKTSDNAGASSVASSIVSQKPEGRYTAPPILIGQPGVNARIQSALIEWLTDREANSFVQYGLTASYGSETGLDDFISSHSVTILDLEPETAYHYRVKYTDQDGNTGYSNDSSFTTADALSAPTNLTVTPVSNTKNSFTFSWGLPIDEGITVKGYFYSINSTPTESNTSFTSQTTLGQGSYATRQGTNTFYVVAVDNANNVNYSNYAFVDFEATTPAPPIPTGIIITDASNRETKDYSIALKWKKISYSSSYMFSATDEEVVNYSIYRSTDNINFANIATILSTGYLDVDLDNSITYYYYIVAKDSAGSTSAPSTIVSDTPQGRYTTPPEITELPSVVPDSFTAIVSWKTERPTTSFVEFGVDQKELKKEQGQSSLVSDHLITLTGLLASTKYWYQIKSVDIDGNIALSPISSFDTLEAPRVSEVTVNDIRLYNVLITWKTNKSTTTAILYGLKNDYGFSQVDTSNSLTTSHTLKLEHLADDTTYHFKPTGTDATGNIPESGDYTFKTLTFPKVLTITSSNKSQGQTEIRWTTNVSTTSQVEYYNASISPKTQGNTALVTDHIILLYGLEDATTYQFKARGTDAFGYEAVSNENVFTTLEDTTPPEILNVKAESNTIGSGETSKVQIVASWQTNEPATSQVDYGVGLNSGEFTDQSEENTELVMDHLVIISGLAPAKTYHIRVVSNDKAGNQTKSGSYSVLTTRKRESFLQLVISNIQDTFSWIGNVGTLFKR